MPGAKADILGRGVHYVMRRRRAWSRRRHDHMHELPAPQKGCEQRVLIISFRRSRVAWFMISGLGFGNLKPEYHPELHDEHTDSGFSVANLLELACFVCWSQKDIPISEQHSPVA